MRAIKKFIRRHSMSLSLVTLICLFTIVALANYIFISIPAGHAGVLWKRFDNGTVVEHTFPEGFHIIMPWNKMTIYNVRLNETTATFDVLAKDGLKITVDFLLRYRPTESELGYLHKNMGEDYLHILVLPELSAKARDIMAQYSPEQIYSLQRNFIQEKIETDVKRELEVTLSEEAADRSLIFLEDVLIKNIHLPDTVRLAIEAKVEHKHRMLQYEYILKREAFESDRKAVEAKGIRQFQDIIKDGISDRYLRWKGIDATLELARSPNAKIVVIGAGKEGMPLILGNMDSPSPDNTTNVKEAQIREKLATSTPDRVGTPLNQIDGKMLPEKTFAEKMLETLPLDQLTGQKPEKETAPASKEAAQSQNEEGPNKP